MIPSKIEAALNRQIDLEGYSSMYYLAMGSWSEVKGYSGVAQFLYHHSDEERMHMLKLIRFINERGGFAIVPPLEQPIITFLSLQRVFEEFLKHEIIVSENINELVGMALNERDYATHNFLQWYVNEQIEEEHLARTLNDKLELVGEDKGGIYLFDRDINIYRTNVGKKKSS